jgi:copper chaperone CopZ
MARKLRKLGTMSNDQLPTVAELKKLYRALQAAILFFGLSLFFSGSLLSAAPRSSGDEVQVIVKGVAVPYSVFGVISRLEQIPGVANVSFDMRHGLADIKFKPGAHVTDEQLREAIKNASYTPGDIHWITPEKDPAKAPETGQTSQR